MISRNISHSAFGSFMKSTRALSALSLFTIVLGARLDAQSPPALSYPAAPRGSQVDDYHGTKVADPYRWLEDVDSPATKAWVEAENKLTFGYLATIPERTAIRNRLTQLWNYPKYDTPEKIDDLL